MLVFAAALIGLAKAQNADPSRTADWIKLTREAVRAEALGEKLPAPTTCTQAKPVFVTIERDGKVLGCRGSLTPRAPTIRDDLLGILPTVARYSGD